VVLEGAVIKGKQITQPEAEARRKVGEDVVVCGDDIAANRRLAQTIETNANGLVKRCIPHESAGPRSLPHYQPVSRPPEGHTFYEFMKHPSEKPPDDGMKFFTRDLYLRFNSPDDTIANQADDDAEAALSAYRQYLRSVRDRLPREVQKLTNICLHDADLLAFDERFESVAWGWS
jgi:hypothetical protein